MKSRNKKVMKGMKFVAVLSILSMTVFSYSYNIVLADEAIAQNTQYESHTDEIKDTDSHEDSSVGSEHGDDKDSSHVSNDDSDHSSYSHKENNKEDSDKSGHDSDKSDKDQNTKGDDKGHDSDDNKNNSKDHDKITICHATHSSSNPYVKITISVSGEEAHKHHQDYEDIIPAPQKGCPGEHDHDSDNNGNHDDHGDDNHDDHDCDKDHDSDEHDCQSNTAPVISLIGNSTINIYEGEVYNDQGATAFDKEDGNITSKIVKAGAVDTSVVGSYVIKYDVTDSNGLRAHTVTRTVNVLVNDDDNGCDGDNDADDVGCETNTAPVITLLGLNPITITQGDFYLDPGATANDHEDGDITVKIVKSGSVDNSVIGTYTITYNVSDSKGLNAVTVTRTVNVVPAQSSNKGKITFCLVLANDQNMIATSSYALPQGVFAMSLGTTTGIATSTIFTKTWDSASFAPNQKVILGQNDSDCITYGNLDYGTYTYSQMSVNGSTWNTPKYNDQSSQPVNNVFDFFSYNNGEGDGNSDGVLSIGNTRPERTVYVYNTYKAGPMCELPEVTSTLSVNATLNQNFTLTLNASSTSSVDWNVATTSLPVGLSFATSTNTISGIPTVVGVYSIALVATNSCGFTDKTLEIKVIDGTQGGGGGTPTANLSVIKTSNKASANTGDEVAYTITLENKGPDAATTVKVTDILPAQLDFVSASTSVGAYATSTGVWLVGNFANGSSTSLVIIGKVKAGTEGQNIANTASAVSDQSDSDTTNNTSTVNISVINPNSGGNGGGGGGSGGGSGSNGPIAGSYGGGSVLGTSTSSGVSALPAVQGCNYLLDYLRSDFDNKPFEVLKLQLFLKNLEGFTNLPITSVYDQATIDAVNIFQMRYKDDVLTPWGHTAPTSYVYILTKKKVNEIFCKVAFPVTSAQQEEIDNYRNSHNGQSIPANSESVSGSVGYNVGGTKVGNTNNNNNIVFGTTSTSTLNSYKDAVSNVANVGLTTLAGFSSSTKGVASDFLANIIASGKKIGSLLSAIFTIPGKLSGKISQNSCQNNLGVFTGLNMFLALLILVISYFWYREYRNNKKIEEINKEIDLQ